jgi:DnaJ-domain-containing protein 1
MANLQNRLPPKARYDDPVPQGPAIEQWRWLIANWIQATAEFQREVERFRQSLASAAEQRLRLQAAAEPRDQDQRRLLGELDQITLWRSSLGVRRLEAEEALADIVSMKEALARAIEFIPAKLEARIARFQQLLERMEAQDRSTYEDLLSEARSVTAACPDYKLLCGQYPIFAFFVRDHLGGEMPCGWVTVSAA